MSVETPGATGPAQEAPIEERVNTAVAIAYGQHGYLDENGEPDPRPIVDKLHAQVGRAIAERKAERSRVCVTRRAMMLEAFVDVPGPESWAEQDDPAVAEGVYKRLDGVCWRMTAMTADGPIQSRLMDDGSGLVLCRTKVNPHRTDAVYVTRDLGCLLEDAIKPQRAKEKQRADRDAAFTAMLIERVPEHGKRFNRELVGGLTTALNSAKAIVAGALEASVVEADDDEPIDETNVGGEE